MNIIDLFAGCGGMSLGFSMAGFTSVVASEIDAWAAQTYTHNHPSTKLICGDIRQIHDWDILLPKTFKGSIDGIIGGPPCQGFSLSGNRDPRDPRNSLFMDFIRCIKYFQPRFFVMENVPGLLSMRILKGTPVIDVILSECSLAGYKAAYRILNAAHFGVPQLRERVFIIGVQKSYPYSKMDLFPQPELNPEKFITVDMALSDLPPIEAGQGAEYQDYFSTPQNSYQKWARRESLGIFNHIAMRHTQRLIERFKIIRPGQSVADVPYEHSALKRGNPKIKSGKVYGQNNMRVHGNAPAPTVAASFQSNFIHPSLNRNFTAREGARLQSFPDNYIFKGKRTTMSWEKNLSQYQQIGNAVPPLLARAIAQNIARYFAQIDLMRDDGGHLRPKQLSLFGSEVQAGKHLNI
ncbi:MAG: DNA cytosine methyltransferase [Desulfatibacillaceae bacterium]|nr:DNA cytosine methyltransferase [Desulfatibacillaceae bacterium]